MRRLPRFLQILGVNSVPVVGVFAADWAAATALALYWCENVMVTALVGLRIWLHRRATGKRGHYDADSPGPRRSKPARGSSFLTGFLVPASVFTAGHAVFLAVILFLMLPENFPEARGVDLEMLRQGIAIVAVILGVGFVIDVVRIRHRSFYWIHRMAGRVMGRVVIVHLTIIFGMLAMAVLDGPRGLFMVFAGFKLLADLGTFLGSDELPDPDKPSKMARLIGFLAGEEKGESYARFHREHLQNEQSKARRWESTSPGVG